MTITVEYALTRSEVVRGFFKSLANSPRYLAIILIWDLAAALLILLAAGRLSRPFTRTDAVMFAETAVSFMVLLTIWLFVRAKTSARSFTAAPEGITTQIGKIRAELPWGRVKVISAATDSVLIARANGNAFFIPNRAFSSAEHKAEFVKTIKDWAETAKTA